MSNRGQDQVEEITGNQISRDKKIINEVSPEDAHKIGYLTACEEIDFEKEMIKTLHNAN